MNSFRAGIILAYVGTIISVIIFGFNFIVNFGGLSMWTSMVGLAGWALYDCAVKEIFYG